MRIKHVTGSVIKLLCILVLLLGYPERLHSHGVITKDSHDELFPFPKNTHQFVMKGIKQEKIVSRKTEV